MSEDNRNEKRIKRVRCEEMEWFDDNREWLEREHPGKWLAISGSRLVAIGTSVREVMDKARQQGIDLPLVTAVRRKEAQSVLLIRSCKNT